MLHKAGVPFTVQPADVDETAAKRELAHKPSRDIALALAELKALHVARAMPDALVIGADQLLLFGDEIVSKSPNLGEAAKLLRRLRGHEHRLVTAVVVAQGGNILWRHVDKPVLRMRDFSDEFLKIYLARGSEALLASVGCYLLEGEGAQLFEHIEGDYFSILGLPLLPLLSQLRERGIMPA